MVRNDLKNVSYRSDGLPCPFQIPRLIAPIAISIVLLLPANCIENLARCPADTVALKKNCGPKDRTEEQLGLLAALSAGAGPSLARGPSDLKYSGSPFTFTVNLPITAQTPTVNGSVTGCVSSPALPTGLSLHNTTCAISGTPTVIQTATAYTITASNAYGNTTTGVNITVNGLPPSGLAYPGSPYIFITNVTIPTKVPTVTGTVTNCTSSPGLPVGLNLNTTTCTLSGTPTVSQGATPYTITASNPYGNTTAGISIAIGAPPTGLAYSGSPFTFSFAVTIVTQVPTVTGTVMNCTSSPSLPAGLNINPSTCAISGTPLVTQGATSYTITASNTFGNTTTVISITIL